MEKAKGLRPDTFYHGTSIEAALRIQVTGFDVSRAGTNAGALLGPGIYCTTTLEKAMDYAKGKPAGGIIFELRVDLGRCKTLAANDDLMKTWQQHGYDSAWAPQGANNQNLAENCIKDPANITIVRAISGHTGELKAMGMLVRHNGWLSMIGDEAAADNKFDAFFSHNWAVDQSGRDNHARVTLIYEFLAKFGLRPWLDEFEIQGDINEVLC